MQLYVTYFERDSTNLCRTTLPGVGQFTNLMENVAFK